MNAELSQEPRVELALKTQDYPALLAAARESAKLASSEDNLDEALYAFVDTMTIADNVSRIAVYEKAKSALHAAAPVPKKNVFRPLSISASNFLGLSQVDLDLPSTGLVTLTGSNGAGKSSVLEAIVYGAFGETLRGESPWTPGIAGELMTSMAPGINVVRSATKSGSKKVHAFDGERAMQGTPTKVQEQLQELLPDMETWMQTHVFASDAGSRFSRSKDMDRKKMLEELFGLARLDVAHNTVLTEFACKRVEVDILANKKRSKETARDVAQHEWANAEPEKKIGEFVEPTFSAKEPVTARPTDDERQALRDRYAALSEEHKQLTAQVNQSRAIPGWMVDAMSAAAAQTIVARNELELAKQGKCHVCKRDFEANHIAEAQAAYDAACAEQNKATKAAKDEKERLDAQLSELTQKANAVLSELRKVEATGHAMTVLVKEWEMFDNARDHHNSYIRELKEKREASIRKLEHVQDQCAKRLKEAEHEFRKACTELAAAEHDLAVLDHAKAVLSTKGMRARLLSEALAGLENVTNYWLSRMSSMTVKLSSVSEKKDGKGTYDAISLSIVGAKGSTYRSLSTGEQRRIDASFVLALCEVVGALDGEPGFVAFDEVFDSLDDEGLASVSSALAELSQRRPVLVITHRETLAKSGSHYHVRAGKIAKA